MNKGTTCPISNIALTRTSDLRTTIIEICCNLDSITYLIDSDCLANTITSLLSILILQDQQILSVTVQSKSNKNKMTNQCQEDDAII